MKRAIVFLLILLALPALACECSGAETAVQPTAEPRNESNVTVNDSQGTVVCTGDCDISQPNEFSSEPVASPDAVIGVGFGLAALFAVVAACVVLIIWLIVQRLRATSRNPHVRKGSML